MLYTFKKKSRGEMIRYTRPISSEYINSIGETKIAPPNTIRMSYDTWGHYKGIKFGDGDTATIPPITNKYWGDSAGGTLIAIGQSPQDTTWFKCGSIEIKGIDAHKLHIIELNAAQAKSLDESIKIMPNEDDVEGDCHLMLVKYYHQTNIDFGMEKEAMTEFNDFLHGAWR